MRLAKLKRFYFDEESQKWIPKEKPCYVIPTNIQLLENFHKKGKVFIILCVPNEDVLHLDMTLEEAVKEINDALNFTPHYKIDWDHEQNDVLTDFKEGSKIK